jgi:hypothetical protein
MSTTHNTSANNGGYGNKPKRKLGAYKGGPLTSYNSIQGVLFTSNTDREREATVEAIILLEEVFMIVNSLTFLGH